METYTMITTQYRENYGAHSWDGTGECPQYWKCKGGTTYALTEGVIKMENHSKLTLCDGGVEMFMNAITNFSDYSSEEVIERKDGVTDPRTGVEDWESTHLVFAKPNGFLIEEIVEVDEYSHYRKGIKRINRYRTIDFSGEQVEYAVEYWMEDGSHCDGDDELREWFARNEKSAVA